MNGAWQQEPNELSWTDERTGYQCHAHRVPGLGHLCGYVQIPEGHPFHGVSYSAQITNKKPRHLFAEWFLVEHDWECAGGLFDVHGGVTYSDTGYWDGATGYWYGFDCGHSDDLSPEMKTYGFARTGTYRDLEFVKAQCASLAKQLKQIVA